MKKLTKLVRLTLTALLISQMLAPVFPHQVFGNASDTTGLPPLRLAGSDRYHTAIEIAKNGWQQAGAVVLARGDDFPDALAGAVLAHKLNAPLLLNPSTAPDTDVFSEIKSLQAQTVYLLGGTGALAGPVENTLKGNGLQTIRLQGQDRYETAAAIAQAVTTRAEQAFLASGASFPDALSISAYAAANGIPLLLTDANSLPQATANALTTLGVKSVTLVGGTGVISPNVESTLAKMNLQVNRLAGADRYLTNMVVVKTLTYNPTTVYVATGEDFPDALAGAALAAKNANPLVLVPPGNFNSETAGYLSTRRNTGASFTMLGGWGVIPYGVESMIRTGSAKPRFSLQYVHGSSYTGQMNQLNSIPGNATDYVDAVAPSWLTVNDPPSGANAADGSVSGIWDGPSTQGQYTEFVRTAHARGLKVLPSVREGSAIDSVLSSESARTNLENQLLARVQATGADGLVIDFEVMQTASGPGLTKLMQDLAARLRALNKLTVIAVMSRTGANNEPWLAEFNYHDLAQAVDYFDIMTYDYSVNTPGPVAPLDWVAKVLAYTQSQGVNMGKVLLGIPYYARDWAVIPPQGDAPETYTHSHWSYASVLDIQKKYNSTVNRDKNSYTSGSPLKDTVGIPYFTYTDANNTRHTVYYDDPASWEAKLQLLDQYQLGGIGAWSLYWITGESRDAVYPLLQRHLR